MGGFVFAQVISTAADGATVSVFAADVDGDGDVDVLSASFVRRQDRVVRERRQPHELHRAWWNPSRPCCRWRLVRCLRRTWTATAIWTCSRHRRNDDTIAWYENDGSGTFTKPTSSTTADQRHISVDFAADVDGDGDLDVLSASFNDDKIAWYENTDGSGALRDRSSSISTLIARSQAITRVCCGRGRRRGYRRALHSQN